MEINQFDPARRAAFFAITSWIFRALLLEFTTEIKQFDPPRRAAICAITPWIESVSSTNDRICAPQARKMMKFPLYLLGFTKEINQFDRQITKNLAAARRLNYFVWLSKNS